MHNRTQTLEYRKTMRSITSLATQMLLPAIEAAGKEDTLTQFAGTYRDEQCNFNITLAVGDSPGLNIED
ncbi:hypothetical protein F4811DRAFT_537817 [Daldinia bambusicola]|nr:hypothetical protein F4811DRAFT_537817 [Daldinia bambusicola]